MELNSLDPTSICRLCATTNSDLIEVFGDIGQECEILTKIHTHLPIMVTEEDILPVNVCHDCFNKLEFCHTFVTGCLEADQKLKQMFGFDNEYNEEDTNSEVERESEMSPVILFPQDIPDTEFQKEKSTFEGVNSIPDDEILSTLYPETQNVSDMQCDVEMTEDGDIIQKSMCINLESEESHEMPQSKEVAFVDTANTIVPDLNVGCEISSKTRLKVKEPVQILILNPKNPNEVTPEDVLQALTNPDSIKESFNPLEALLKQVNEKEEGSQAADESGHSLNLKNVKKIKRTLMYCCMQCPQIFPEKKKLLIHQSLEHKRKKSNFTCTICNQPTTFSSRESLNEHNTLHHSEILSSCANVSSQSLHAPSGEDNTFIPDNDTQDNSEITESFLGAADFLLNNENENSEKDIGCNKSTPDDNEEILNNSIPESDSLMTNEKEKPGPKVLKRTMTKRKNSATAKWQCKCCTSKSLTGFHKPLNGGIPYDCLICNEKFCSYGRLANHMAKHGKSPTDFVCEICGKGFYHPRYLKIHNKKHNPTPEYPCPDCKKVFNNKVSLKTHLTVHSDRIVLCDICGKGMKEGSFRLHKITHEEPEALKRFRCLTCGKGFRSMYHLKEHANDHTNETPYKCPDCPKKFRKKTQLKQHSLVHMEVPKYPCTVCGRRFRRRDHLQTHSRTHEPKHKFPCRVCTEIFSSLKELHDHRMMHTEEEINMAKVKNRRVDPQECQYCGKVLLNKLTLQSHMMIHKANREKSFKCDECGKAYDMKSKLEVHKRLHTGEKPYQCSYCSSSFTVKCSLVVHERAHTGETPFKCDKCDKAFRSQSCLVQHKAIHMDARPYSCQICGRSFRRRDGRDAHTLVHTSERPWSCRLCGRSFKQKGERNRHEGKHFKSRSRLMKMPRWFACAECGKTFKTEHLLKRHIEIEHGSVASILSCESFVETEVIVSEFGEEEDIETEIIPMKNEESLLSY